MATGSTEPREPTREVVYPYRDNRGESALAVHVRHLLIGLFEDYFAALEREALVGGNQFFYYREGDPRPWWRPTSTSWTASPCTRPVRERRAN